MWRPDARSWSRLLQRSRARRLAGAAVLGTVVVGLAALLAWGCEGFDPREPFTRNAPEVDLALREIDAGRYESAEEILARYLETGPCDDGVLRLPDRVRERPAGAFDLGLTLFALAERHGRRFGEEGPESATPSPADEQEAELRRKEVDCALIVTKAIAGDARVPVELRARAHYLAGNLEFLRGEYEAAVRAYDAALTLSPGREDGGDEVGRDAAWNRAIALRRQEERRDAGDDASDPPDAADAPSEPDTPDPPDAGEDGGAPDAGEDGGADGPEPGDDGGGGEDGGGERDAGGDGAAGDGAAPAAQPPEPERAPRENLDERMLDRLEQAPTLQQEEARHRAGVRRGRVLEDK